MRILVAEDSVRLAGSLRSGLRKLGHAVDVVHDGHKALSYARLNPYDVLLLDIMMPGLDGLTVLQELRSGGCETQVLLLTAKDTVQDRVAGLKTGADDYLVKPFAFDELAARIEALGRRVRGSGQTVLTVGDLEVDTSAREVTRAGRHLSLTRREYALIEYLAERQGETVSRIEIEDHLYDEETLPLSNAVASTICTLREKLEQDGESRLIHTRRGLGYVLSEQAP